MIVWEHSSIEALTATLGEDSSPQWPDNDFDSIWIINFQAGYASLSIDQEGINTSKGMQLLSEL